MHNFRFQYFCVRVWFDPMDYWPTMCAFIASKRIIKLVNETLSLFCLSYRYAKPRYIESFICISVNMFYRRHHVFVLKHPVAVSQFIHELFQKGRIVFLCMFWARNTPDVSTTGSAWGYRRLEESSQVIKANHNETQKNSLVTASLSG